MAVPRSSPSPPRRAIRVVWLPLTAVALLLPVATLSAQLAELRPGARARLRAPGALAGEVEGVVLAQRGDTVLLAIRDAAPVPVPLAAITSAAVYRGQDRAAGARKGARWGAGVGLGFGVLNAGFSDCTGAHCGTGDKALGAVALTAVGTGVGALVGAAVRAERWQRLAVPPRATTLGAEVR